MLAPKPLLSSSNPSNLHLPSVSKTIRRRHRPSPTPSYSSMVSTTTNASDNVSALKAKYTDYAMWLKASARQNREPLFTHELLKHSLCQMGIDTTQADQLVSTCSWYVYQFQKELGGDTEQHDQSVTTETKKQHQSSKDRHKKIRKTKSKKTISQREHSADSAATTTTSINKENLVSPGPPPPTRNKYSILPAIDTSELSISPRSRHVDFDNELMNSHSIGKPKPSQWRSAISKARILPKLRPSETESSVNGHNDGAPEGTAVDLDLSSSQKNLSRRGLSVGHTRSILRKQVSSCSSVTSIDVVNRNHRHRILTPSSSIIYEVPLGTRSQRLFGGSECFAEIMNELEEQKLE